MKSFFFALISLTVLGIFLSNNAFAAIQQDNTIQLIPYYAANGTQVATPYRLTQNATFITYESQEGSYIFNSNTCTLTKYPKGLITSNNPEFSDNFQVLASNTANGTSGWNPVGIINSQTCVPFVNTINSTSVSFGATKTLVGGGSFTITYTKVPQHDLKITISATNNNPAWTNYHLGLREIISGVQRNVTLGGTTYDLSQHNNTGLNRAFISTHSAQFIQLDKTTGFSMGLGWNNVNSVTDIYHIGNPTLQIDYTYNTPILSPGNTITIDPSITKDTSTNCNTAGGTTCPITIGNNSNRVLFAMIYSSRNPGNPLLSYASSVKIGSTPFTFVTHAAGNTTISTGVELWKLVNPPTGTQTITVTWGSTPTYSTIGLISLYNVNQVHPINLSSLNTTSGTTVPAFFPAIITPTSTGSWILGTGVQDYAPFGTASNTADYTVTDTLGNTASVLQHNASPSIGSKNVMSWTIGAAAPAAGQGWGSIAYEVMQANVPSTPTISKVNTINNTAINATWTAPSGATWFWLNATLSGGATTHINTTKTTLTLNNYTAGSRYTFSLVAANGTGKSSGSITKYNYTTNIAPTSLLSSLITSSSARVTVTNPSGNFSGYNVYDATPNSGIYVLAGTSSNSTNRFDLTGLLGNQQYSVKFSTRYAVGTNYTGNSANSTTVSFYTLPNAPAGLGITQVQALVARLAWTAPTDNGTVTGYKVERSNNAGLTWSTISANTGNATVKYNDTLSVAGTYSYRVSTIKYGGTSTPSNVASKSIWNFFTVREYQANGITPVYGLAIQSNSTSSNNRFTLVSGLTIIPGISQNNNFTAWNSLINFVVGKQYNYNATLNHSLNMTTNDYSVDCASTGTGIDVEVWTNGTDGHRISTFTTPTCFSNNTMKWTTKFTANGNSAASYNTTVYVKAVNATFGTVAPLKYNNTKVTTIFSNPYIISNPVIVGTGLQTKVFNWSMNLTVSPAFTPVNFTVGHISVSGVNPVTTPIKFTTTAVNSSATAVTVTFPSTYTMAYQLTYGNEGTSQILSGLPVTSPSLGLGQTTITFKNPSNDFVTIKAYDKVSNTTASTILAQPNSNVPFVTQFKNFKNGLFGTSAMIGGINIIDLIVLIVAMIGLNRANEIVGAFMMVIIVGVAGFFQIITWPTAMVSGIALAVLVTVVTMKKYQNS